MYVLVSEKLNSKENYYVVWKKNNPKDKSTVFERITHSGWALSPYSSLRIYQFLRRKTYYAVTSYQYLM